jgi:hypothetical protein
LHGTLTGLPVLLRSIGKMTIPLDIMNSSGNLTDEEFGAINEHSMIGYRMLFEGKAAGEIALELCLHHHEKWMVQVILTNYWWNVLSITTLLRPVSFAR